MKRMIQAEGNTGNRERFDRKKKFKKKVKRSEVW
jgi:hypothetical protein